MNEMLTDDSATSLPAAAWKRSFRAKLRAWFDAARRDLPWRRTRDPYAVWVSEIMLQQTQVATVTGYYTRFLAAFPDVASLAAADEADVLRRWEGLGYYRRARQLHRAAQQIVAEHGGRFPRDREQVRALPGIGRYTAGAILSIAFDAQEPILEANTIRLLSRLTALRASPQTPTSQALLWAWAEALVPASEPGLFNQALMELGALVCTPRNPACGECPVAGLCPTRRLGLQDVIPAPKAKPKFEDVREGAVIVRRRNTDVLLVRRGEKERWAGLWDFPRFSLEAETYRGAEAELAEKTRAALGIDVVVGRRLHTLRHGVTRFRITLEAFAAEHRRGRLKPTGFAEARWFAPSALVVLPLTTPARRLSRVVLVDGSPAAAEPSKPRKRVRSNVFLARRPAAD